MFITKNKQSNHVLRASQASARTVVQSDLLCPICGKDVVYNHASEHLLDSFHHANGSPDCFQSDAASDEHRLAVEVAVEAIYNRLTEVTGEPVDIDIERQIGSPSNFIIADVRVSSPLQIAAEIFYKVGDLALRRRLNTLSAHDYRTFLIFHSDGTHDIDRIDRHLQRISPLNPGRFDADMMDIVLGDLFSWEHLDFTADVEVPNYIYTG